MRYRLRLLVVLIVHILVALFLWSFLNSPGLLNQSRILAFAGRDTNGSKKLINITCNINGEYNVSCRKEKNEVYIPFSFIKKYFDVYGKLVEKNGVNVFNWSHSYATVYIPKRKYDPRGIFTHFQSYKVEERERVKCISASEGVPISTQWDPKGYYYPTQIAQFALSHYSKNLIESNALKYVLEDGESNKADWITSSEDAIRRILDVETDSTVTCFNNPLIPITLNTNISLIILSFNLRIEEGGEFVVVVQNLVDKELYTVHYTCDHQHIQISNQDIYYGLFCDKHQSKWFQLSRDLFIDVTKGIMLKTQQKHKKLRSAFRIQSMYAIGRLCIDNLTALSGDHSTHFQLAVNWFLNHQEKLTGGWPNPVTRKMAGSLILKPGWYSAMGQGHALSVLARAYHLTEDVKYLEAGINALKLFKVPSIEKGILAMFLNQIPWYEEYPTEPATFVLNGFIYSLIGLYDFYTMAPTEYSQEARVLYLRGMASLKKMLTIFDTGSGTTYDLRHITMGTAPKVARWDYHATHINQLLMLSTIEKDPLLVTTAKRWMGYMNGKRAAHN